MKLKKGHEALYFRKVSELQDRASAVTSGIARWDSLTMPEKEETVALRIGWIKTWTEEAFVSWERRSDLRPDYPARAFDIHVSNDRKPWFIDDRSAFADVLPRLIENPQGLKVSLVHLAGKPVLQFGPKEDPVLQLTGNSWADVLCHGAYRMLPEAEVVERKEA
jgi:hypothetical protein